MSHPTVAITVGHHPDAPGAILRLADRSVSEFPLWRPFAYELSRTFPAGVDAPVVERPNPKPDDALGAAVGETDPDCAIELHFNAWSGSEASGTKMLHWPGSDGEDLAAFLLGETLDALELQDDGLEARKDNGFLRNTPCPAVVCEPAFGTNSKDAFIVLTRLPRLMRAYRNAVLRYLNVADHAPDLPALT